MRILSRVVLFISLFILAGTAGMFSANFLSATEKIDINTAPLEDLIKIIHIGGARALELISLRPFSSLDDLARIKGIGEKRIEDIKKQGLAWVDTREEPESESEPESEPESELLPQGEPKPAEEPWAEPEPTVYPSGIVINEILPNTPVGIRDEEGEYIEIFNQNSFEVNLSGWQIEDTMGRTTAYTFSKGTKISPRGFLVFYRPTTKITLNNDGDGLNLIQPDGKIIDSIVYEKAPQGESYNRIDSKWSWSTTLTPGSANIIPAPISETKEAEPSQEEVKKPAFKEEAEKKRELAAVGEQIPKEASFVPLLIALAIAIFSGVIILILKRKLRKIDLLEKLE